MKEIYETMALCSFGMLCALMLLWGQSCSKTGIAVGNQYGSLNYRIEQLEAKARE